MTVGKIARWLLIGLPLLLLALVAVRLLAPISTPPFRQPDGRPEPDSIASVERWAINGQMQSVILRGRHRSDPILLVVHGGPGSSETAVLRQFNAVLEDHFVVVYWDQRHAGRSLDPFSRPPEKLTVRQYVDDLAAVVAQLRRRFHRDRVVILGHSWGTVPGILYAQQHPETVAAYVGVGQMADVMESERRSYAFALREARARGNAKAIAELEAMGPPPRADGGVYTSREWLAAFGGAFHDPKMTTGRLVLIALRSSEVNWRDLAGFQMGARYADSLIQGEMKTIRFGPGAFRIGAPVFVLSGRYDQQSEASVAHEFFGRITAPEKHFIWFERSAHNPPFEEPDAFNRVLIEQVRPLALRR